MTDLVAATGAALTGGPDIEVTLTSWRPRSDLTYEQWEAAGRQLGIMGRACQWWIGDWIRYGEHAFGERYTQAIEDTGLDYQTLRNYVWVAERIDVSRRRDSLSWSHHAEVAALDPADADAWLDIAETDGLTRDKLRCAIRRTHDERRPPDDATVQDTPAYRTVLVVEHHAADPAAAADQIEQAARLLERRGLTVLNTSTDPAGP